MNKNLKTNPRPAKTRIMIRFCLRLILISVVLPGAAATRYWTGNASVFWKNSANWTNGLLPVAGDSIVFLEGAKYTELVNDFEPGLSISNIVFEGRNYTLQGNRIDLSGDINSIPSRSTNRILLDLNINRALTIYNQGYFNQLELGGTVTLNQPLVLNTISEILISGTLNDADNVGTTLHSSSNGRLTVGEGATIAGTVTVDRGLLLLWNAFQGGNLDGTTGTRLIIGDEMDAPRSAEVRLMKSERIRDQTPITINRSGVLNLNGSAFTQGIVETIGGLAGSGMVDLGPSQLIIAGDAGEGFGGVIRGTGALQVGSPAVASVPPIVRKGGTLVISGDLTYDRPIQVIAGSLGVTGSISNAAVSLHPDARLFGSGSIKSLTSNGGVITPGPGTLHILGSCALDFSTILWAHLDGPDAGVLRASTINLGDAFLGALYQGSGTETSFTVVTADTSLSSNFRLDTTDLPEEAWLVAGNPASEFQITYTANGNRDAVLSYGGSFFAPTMSIRRLSAAECIIEWPLAAHDFKLQHTDPEYLGGWTTNGLPTPGTNATDHFVIETNTTSWRLYRLTRPVSPFQ